jgi:Transglutaminase-like superfamily
MVRLRRLLLRPVHHVRTAAWTARELRRLHGTLRAQGAQATVGPPPDRAPRACGRSMLLVAAVGRATCLEKSLLRQAWLAEHGTVRDVVIGVRGGSAEFGAHAWIDGDADAHVYTELRRIAYQR